MNATKLSPRMAERPQRMLALTVGLPALAALEPRDIHGTPTTISAVAAFAYDRSLKVTWDLAASAGRMTCSEAGVWASGLRP